MQQEAMGRAPAISGVPAATTASAEEARELGRQGHQFLQDGHAQRALERFQRALALDPIDASALVGRAVALQELERPEEAIASYDRALELRPDFPAALVNRSNARRMLRRFNEALV